MKLSTLLLASWAVAVTASHGIGQRQPVSYDGYRAYRIVTNGRPDAIKDRLDEALPHYSQWNQDTDGHVDIVVPPREQATFVALGLTYRVMHEDLGSSIVSESSQPSARSKRSSDSWFDAYHSYEEHVKYFQDLHTLFPNNSKIVSSGESYEGRDIFGIHLWGNDGPGKPAILFHGTVHAREWIVAPVLEYITLQLINEYKNNDDTDVGTFVLDKYDYYVFPFVNPDGFVYTQKTDRMWRKNRQPPPTNAANSSCYGRDINRNWKFAWDSNPLGASTDPCDDTYRGEAPSDSVENQGLDKFARKLRDEQGIKLFIDWHSYGQYIMYPFSYNETIYPPELGKWAKLAAFTSRAILNYDLDVRTTFMFGPNGATLYPTTGSAPDHIYAVGKADFAYTIELRDLGDFGFVLPPAQIRPSAEEMWAGQEVMLSLMGEAFFDGKGQV